MRRIVIDTNCLIAILPSKSPYHKVWTDFLEQQLEICVSNEILMEYEEIISEKTSPAFAEAIIKTLINKPNFIRVYPTWRFGYIVTDPDDNKFVDCAICGRAELLVSNDKHFNVLKDIGFPYVRVLRIQDFVQILN
jgi:putative PIN family toxin of toxin-antitoxin system